MSDQARTTRDAAASLRGARVPAAAPAEMSPPVASHPVTGPGLRLDAAHLPHLASDPIPLETTPFPDSRIDSLETTAELQQTQTLLADPDERNEDSEQLSQLLVQASQIADHLKEQNLELERREQRINSQLALLDQERRNVRLWAENVETAVREREEALALNEADCAARADTCLQLEQELQELNQTLLRERHNINEERTQFDREMAEQRAAVEAEVETRREEVRQEKTLQENRFRFQNDHLQRARQEFESMQAEFRFEQQASRVSLEYLRQQLDLRRGQLDRYRELLEEREHSVARERESLVKSRRALDESFRQDQDRLRREQETWESEHEQQRADVRRQQDLLAVHAENLETRRVRLDQLRAELEQTNRSTLEMRVAVEEAYAQLAQAHGAESARTRVDAARDILVEHYQHTRDSLLSQRQEIEQVLERTQQQRQDLLAEREDLREWIGLQEERLQHRAVEVEEIRQTLSVREEQWRNSRDRWTNEKLEAETVIRNLLRRLTASESHLEEIGHPGISE